MLDFLEEHLPKPLRLLVEKSRKNIPFLEFQKLILEQERFHFLGNMSL